MDRFMMKVYVDYPSKADELEIMRRMANTSFSPSIDSILTKEEIFEIRDEINKVNMIESIQQYIIELVFATRTPKDYNIGDVANYIEFGVSPRASIALNQAAKATAYFAGRQYVLPEDIKEVATDILNHRILLNYEAEADGVNSRQIVKTILDKIPIS